MKKLISIAAVAVLAACSQQAEDPAAPAATTAATQTPADTVAISQLAGPEAAGSYEVTWADGTVTTTMINADGTYVDTMDGDETSHGTWAVKEGKSCLTPEGGAELCWTDGTRADDGSWEATAEDGTKVIVRKAEADAAATA
ncbi:hypothetical protein [Pelagerythrobacter sp.]|uniref:hypothetical protein n=1 Tax=Pelagerythrobacter sp. TaxID=2800702 RepID=UPI0035B09349